ncbi:MAG: UPF0280 family protein [Thermodesulfobacteriota bacterium]
METERKYRRRMKGRDLVGFEVKVRETDLWIGADRPMVSEAKDLVFSARQPLEAYVNEHPEFLSALSPVPDDTFAPPIVRDMIHASGSAGVGPMAAVAGAVAEHVGTGLLALSSQVIVENGGDVFLSLKRAVTVTVLAGRSPLSMRVGLRISARSMPVGVCSSSGSVGHSLSLGRADAACVVARSTALADSTATALGNRIKKPADLEKAASWASQIKGVRGGLVVLGKAMAAWGDVELVKL